MWVQINDTPYFGLSPNWLIPPEVIESNITYLGTMVKNLFIFTCTVLIMLLGFQPAIAERSYCVSIPPEDKTALDTANSNQYREGITDYYKYINEKENDNKIKIITNEDPNCKKVLLEIESYKPVKRKSEKTPIISVSHNKTKEENSENAPYQFFLIPDDDKFADAAIEYMGKRLGGKENLKGKTIMTLSSSDYDDDDSFSELSKGYPFTYKSERIYASDTKQNFIWPYISEHRPTFILLRGDGIDIPLVIQNATKVYYPVSKLIGRTWDDHSEDLEKLEEIADGYQTLSVFNFTTGKSTDDSNEKSANSSDSIYWKLGRLAALVSSKAINDAKETFKNSKINRGQVRWALENLNLSKDDLKEIGIENLVPPIKMDCNNHNILREIYIQKWDADNQSWASIYDFIDENDGSEGKKCMDKELLKVILDRSSSKEQKLKALNALLKAKRKILGYAYLPNITLTTQKDLTEADLTGADLFRADLTGADLSNTTLTGANLSNTILTGANLTGANLTGADFFEADLTGAVLSNAILTAVNLYDVKNGPDENFRIPEQYRAYSWSQKKIDDKRSSDIKYFCRDTFILSSYIDSSKSIDESAVQEIIKDKCTLYSSIFKSENLKSLNEKETEGQSTHNENNASEKQVIDFLNKK